jgi:uncharacterized membrane protein required for colicin V production
MNWVLIIVLVILVVSALIGMKVGLIKTIFSLCSMILALGLSLWISPYVNDYLRGNNQVSEKVMEKVDKFLPEVKDKTNQNDQVSIIEGLPLPESLRNSLIENNNKETYKKLSVNNFKGYLNGYLSSVIISVMAFVVTFIIIQILLWVISMALDILGRLPLIKQVNKLAGLLVGLAQGLVVVWIFFLLLTVFGSSEWGQKAMEMIGENQILSLIYNNNILLEFITNVSKML